MNIELHTLTILSFALDKAYHNASHRRIYFIIQEDISLCSSKAFLSFSIRSNSYCNYILGSLRLDEKNLLQGIRTTILNKKEGINYMSYEAWAPRPGGGSRHLIIWSVLEDCVYKLFRQYRVENIQLSRVSEKYWIFDLAIRRHRWNLNLVIGCHYCSKSI